LFTDLLTPICCYCQHFYMETFSVHVDPGDNGRYTVNIATQNAAGIQADIVAALGSSSNKVNVISKRSGGGFGGKVFRNNRQACAAAIGAHKHRRCVRSQNERVDDLIMCGAREPMFFEYKCGFEPNGHISSIKVQGLVDTGNLMNESLIALGEAIGLADNVYYTENWDFAANPVSTNTPSNTPMRAPGSVQSIHAHETIIDNVSYVLGKRAEDIRELNFYQPGQRTPSGDIIGSATFNWTIPQLWQGLKSECQFEARTASVAAFNLANRFRKRGIAMTPTKWAHNLGSNSQSAFICVYSNDGTIEVSTGGSEIGQGLNTKVAQGVALAFGLTDLSLITVLPLDTSKTPNSGPTGGSGTSESCVAAATDAAKKIFATVEPFLGPRISWQQAVSRAALQAQAPLFATGSYRNDGSDRDEGAPHHYATYGVACTEAEVDVLTGEMQILRTDLHVDLGTSLNPAVDIGQVEGSFVQGLGYFFTEELLYLERGEQYNVGSFRYKIPSAYDIPIEFNTKLLDGVPNPSGVLSSKLSGEPGMSWYLRGGERESKRRHRNS
jgi:xanthine dehydrogenase/oxidase